MDKKEICKEETFNIGNDSSFEGNFAELNDIFENTSSPNLTYKNEEDKNSGKENEKSHNIFENKYFEEADLDEIYDVLYEINQAVTIDVNTINKNNFYKQKNISKSEQNLNLKNDEDHFNECQEIICILKKPLSNKDIRNGKFYDSPFKPLLKPKKVSLVGKVFYGIPSDDISTKSSSKDDNNNSNNNDILSEHN